MPNNSGYEFDDFPNGMYGSDSAHGFFDCFSMAQNLARQLPKIKGTSDVEIIRTLINEIRSTPNQHIAPLFRKSAGAKEALSTYWISQCRIMAKAAMASSEDVPAFQSISTERLAQIARYSADTKNLLKLPSLLLQDGIVFVIAKALPGMKVDGAAFLLEDERPVVALSLRHDRLDNFWFTLMHELAHVSLHYDRLKTPIIDDLDQAPVDLIEKQADRLGTNSLINRSDWRGNDALYSATNENVVAVAKALKIHPAIVAGRIRNEFKDFTLFTEIIYQVSLRKVFFNEE